MEIFGIMISSLAIFVIVTIMGINVGMKAQGRR